MAMIPGENVDIDFTNPEIYTDEYAEENADTEEFKFIKETPLYKDVRKSLSELKVIFKGRNSFVSSL